MGECRGAVGIMMNMTHGLLLSLLLVAPMVADEATAPKRPNIVVIMSDDMGFSDLGCYGGEIRTPVLDDLAANGMRFSQFYNCARCCPTRAALLTGVYPHQAGVGLMMSDRKLPGYRGDIGRNVLTLAESLDRGGYGCYMSGKWHVAKSIRPNGPKDNWPMQRGFDRFYGTITGAGSFYDPTTLCRGNTYITPENDPEYQPDTYYYTDAISDNAVTFLQEHAKAEPDSPFLLYVAYTTAHWPMHALPEDIERYDGMYDEGFAPIRAARLARLKALGLVDADTELPPGSDDWSKVKHKDWDIRNMEVYAAMVDRMDQGIGRIVAELKAQGVFDQTVIMYLQDNGGCAEAFGRAAPKNPPRDDYKPLGPDGLQPKIWPPMQTRDGRAVRVGPGVMAGPEDTYIGYGRGWANVSNTPFRLYKHWSHEGGISTPLIVHWPEGISEDRQGGIDHQPGHVIDVMATCLELSGLEHPPAHSGETLIPLEGVSLLPALAGEPLGRTDALYFEHHLNCAIRDGDWKLVRKGQTGNPARLFDWELYNIAEDRAELNDLSASHPEKVSELSARWDAWADRALVRPWPWNLGRKP